MNDQAKKFIEAAEEGDCTAIMEFLEDGVDLETADEDGFTALHIAANYGHLELLDALIGLGADVEARCLDKEGAQTPLHLAVWQNKKEALMALVEAGASVSAQDNDGFFPLHRAAIRGHHEVLAILLEAAQT